ncbi:phage tail terminator protein [Sphaerotilus uruguayifluvii]|jgi:hypothetical protein|uniref:Uncharacterized protein n=1 Tax=Sphaerotilus uruguayifluvii TaxID=2735897 RepID=A0ABX2G0G3_9BURK|nr:hypothetical protein [Leptothrix sp. C29]NRT54802.1 hypothetical protein [Leptothrix sp. C29]
MDLTPVITRLRQWCPAGTFRQIGGAAELDAAISSAPVTPSAFVMPLADRADDPYLASYHLQHVMRHFAIVLCVANRADATGEAAASELASRRSAVAMALLGWAPDESTGDPIAYSSGRVLRFADGRLWWSDEYRHQATNLNLA